MLVMKTERLSVFRSEGLSVCLGLAETWGISGSVCQTYCLDETQAAESTNHWTPETHTHTHSQTHNIYTQTAVHDEITSAGLMEHTLHQ